MEGACVWWTGRGTGSQDGKTWRSEDAGAQKQGRIEWQLRLAGLLLEWLEDIRQEKDKKEEYVALWDVGRATCLLPFWQERGVFFRA